MRVDTFEEQCELGRVWVYAPENFYIPIIKIRIIKNLIN